MKSRRGGVRSSEGLGGLPLQDIARFVNQFHYQEAFGTVSCNEECCLVVNDILIQNNFALRETDRADNLPRI